MPQKNVLLNAKEITCKTCGALKHQNAKYKWINTCDECGKKEEGLRDKGYLGDFYEITVFRNTNDSERKTFCTPKHMMRYVSRLKPKDFNFITLPYVHGLHDADRRELKRSLTISDLKRMMRRV